MKFRSAALCIVPLILCCAVSGCHDNFNSILNRIFPLDKVDNTAMTDNSVLPRYTQLKRFNPHRKDFTCVYQAQHLPPTDPQAELWFQQAMALDDPNIFYKDKDWKKIFQLYQQAADRGHWKAMLNLATLMTDYPDYPLPSHDPETAIELVEKAMNLGVPDAWDMMGVYHLHGLVPNGDATSAYAFFQEAADMGSPRAQVFLGEALDATWDNPGQGFWANIPVATKMLECAFAQGNGDAADRLSYDYARTGYAVGGTPQEKRRALETLQQGVRLGSVRAANSISAQFSGMYLTEGTSLVQFEDDARFKRYRKIADYLEFYNRAIPLPNLDKVLPLPPARLPKWDGNIDTLINAAKAVTPPIKKPAPQPSSRKPIPEGYVVPSPTPQSPMLAGTERANLTGYWLALDRAIPAQQGDTASAQPARSGHPEYYHVGEAFEPPMKTWLTLAEVHWYYLGEAVREVQPHEHTAALVQSGQMRALDAAPEKLEPCKGDETCTQTGIWKASVNDAHPLAVLYNQQSRQAFVEKGAAFPDPHVQHLDIEPKDIRWTYLGSPNKVRIADIYDIAL